MKWSIMLSVLFASFASADSTMTTDGCHLEPFGLPPVISKISWSGSCTNGKASGLGLAELTHTMNGKARRYKSWVRATDGVIWGLDSYEMTSINGRNKIINYTPPNGMIKPVQLNDCAAIPRCREVLEFYSASDTSESSVSTKNDQADVDSGSGRALYAFIINHRGIGNIPGGIDSLYAFGKNLDEAKQNVRSQIMNNNWSFGEILTCKQGWLAEVSSARRGGKAIGVACDASSPEEAIKIALGKCRERNPECGHLKLNPGNNNADLTVFWGKVGSDFNTNIPAFEVFADEGQHCYFGNGYIQGDCKSDIKSLEMLSRFGIRSLE